MDRWNDHIRAACRKSDAAYRRALAEANPASLARRQGHGRHNPCSLYSGWTPEREAELTRLWDEGLTASQIARMMGGLTRNAVIGKVHRLGLPKRGPDKLRASPKRTRKCKSPSFVWRPRSSKRAKAMPEIEDLKPEPFTPKPINFTSPNPVTFLQLTDKHCRWIIGEPDGLNTLYCGERKAIESSYCRAHDLIASGGIPVRKPKQPKPAPVASAEAWCAGDAA